MKSLRKLASLSGIRARQHRQYRRFVLSLRPYARSWSAPASCPVPEVALSTVVRAPTKPASRSHFFHVVWLVQAADAFGGEVLATFLLIITVFAATDGELHLKAGHISPLLPFVIGMAVFVCECTTLVLRTLVGLRCGSHSVTDVPTFIAPPVPHLGPLGHVLACLGSVVNVSRTTSSESTN